jgi:hypothetical protein
MPSDLAAVRGEIVAALAAADLAERPDGRG